MTYNLFVTELYDNIDLPSHLNQPLEPIAGTLGELFFSIESTFKVVHNVIVPSSSIRSSLKSKLKVTRSNVTPSILEIENNLRVKNRGVLLTY
jgi:hypothetical protein